ncbi:hypothetical protein GCM10010987_59630 [Bradyrhizobium guangdongense]|uniref:Uncharacterized protein n=1 Tax=Bradyrhizobium guangdongense TaxID=1325090 RepID=A0AA87WB95_9BRAD|nr:hypothetical protein GCM10010987_59630 [Bradyrhizobium guangdongense]
MAACAALGANVPNGAVERALSGVKQAVLVAGGACIAGFGGDSKLTVIPGREASPGSITTGRNVTRDAHSESSPNLSLWVWIPDLRAL